MCMFRVRAEPAQFIVQDVDGLIVKVQAECCVQPDRDTAASRGSPTCPDNESHVCRRAGVGQRHIAERRRAAIRSHAAAGDHGRRNDA